MASYPVERIIDREYDEELYQLHKDDPVFAPRPLPSLAAVLKLEDRAKCPLCAGTGRLHSRNYFNAGMGAWRYTLKNEECEDCGGKGFTKLPQRLITGTAQSSERRDPCADCRGTGQKLDSGCPDCEGINCQKCRGTGGAEPCPACWLEDAAREDARRSLGTVRTKVKERHMVDGSWVRIEDCPPDLVLVWVKNELGGHQELWKPKSQTDLTEAEIAAQDWVREREEARAA